MYLILQIPNIGQQEATQAVQTLADAATHHDINQGLTTQPITMEMNPDTGQITTLPISQGHQIILADDAHIGGMFRVLLFEHMPLFLFVFSLLKW